MYFYLSITNDYVLYLFEADQRNALYFWNSIGIILEELLYDVGRKINLKLIDCYYFNDTNQSPNKLPRISLISTMPSPPPTPPPTPPPSPPPTPPPKPDPPYVLVIRYLLNILFSK